MVNYHFAISLDEQISHTHSYFFFRSFISRRCVRAYLPRHFDFGQHHFSSSTMRMNNAPIPNKPIWPISNALKSFSLVRTTGLPKRANERGKLAFYCSQCKWMRLDASGDAFCILFLSLVANDFVCIACVFLIRPHTSAKWCRILLIGPKYQADSVHQFMLLPVTYAPMPIVT